MSENEETRKILHRVVFYDLLSTPDIEHQRDTYGKIHEAHLSIPLMPGLETVWAPNGYGKTFAMQMLERMWKPTQYSSDQWTTRGGVHWLSDFLRECQAMVLDISDSPTSQKIRESSFHDVEELSKTDWTPAGVQRMVPFSLMMARIVELDSNDQIQEVSDLWIKPNWKNFVTHDIDVEVSRIPMFASYELKFSELLLSADTHGNYHQRRGSEHSRRGELESRFLLELNSDRKDPLEIILIAEEVAELSIIRGLRMLETCITHHTNNFTSRQHNLFLRSQKALFRRHSRAILDYLFVDEEAQSFITERDSWNKTPGFGMVSGTELSFLEKSGLDLSKLIEETENEYWNPIIPPTFNWLMFPISDGDLPLPYNYSEVPHEDEIHSERWGWVSDDGELISGVSTRDRRPPIPFELATGSSIDLEMSNEINSLMEVLRTTKIDYVEIPKESLEFFENPDRATQKVTEITNNLDTSKIQMIEDKINDVLRMKGDTDPWSRKVSLASTLSRNSFANGSIIRVKTPFDFDTKEARIIRLNRGKELKLEIPHQESHSQQIKLFIPSNWQNLARFTEQMKSRIEKEKDVISEWKKELAKAESNVATFEEDFVKDGALEQFNKLTEQKKNIQAELETRITLNQKMKRKDTKENRALLAELEKIEKEMSRIRRDIPPDSFRYRRQSGKEQLALVAEILNELQKTLAFYEESYLILKMFKLEDYEIPDVDRDNPLHFLHTQLSHLGQITDLEQETLEKYESDSSKFTSTLRNKTMFEAYISKLNWMKDTLERQRKTRFEVESPYRNTPLRKDVLSFGQKSTILTELYLGTFEALSAPSSDIDEDSFNENRYCLIIDEPEVGRSEYSLNHLITRLISSKTAHDAELNNSVVVLSHRNKLLKQVSGKYHLLQPVDIGYQTEEE